MMTPRERWLAALQLKPVDRIPFWPKINDSYLKSQKEPFSKMTADEIHDWVGSDSHIYVPKGIREIRKTSYSQTVEDELFEKTTFHTKAGTVESIDQLDIVTDTTHPIKMPIENLDSIKIMTEWYSDCEIDIDKAELKEAELTVQMAGEDGLIVVFAGSSPLMRFVEWLAGIENAHYLLADYPEEVEELFAAMHKKQLRTFEIISETTPADLIYLVEDTSTTIISPAQYHKYCFNHIEEYGNIVKQSGKMLGLHMCGHLKDILPDLSRVNASVFEAFTSPPVGNVRLQEGRSACPDKCLIGGTNCVLWTKDAKTIINEIEEDLNQMPHHRGLVISSGGVMPPAAEPETIKKVSDWLKTYNNIN